MGKKENVKKKKGKKKISLASYVVALIILFVIAVVVIAIILKQNADRRDNGINENEASNIDSSAEGSIGESTEGKAEEAVPDNEINNLTEEEVVKKVIQDYLDKTMDDDKKQEIITIAPNEDGTYEVISQVKKITEKTENATTEWKFVVKRDNGEYKVESYEIIAQY